VHRRGSKGTTRWKLTARRAVGLDLEVDTKRTEDGRTRISCRLGDDSVWLTQAALAELFRTTPQNITLHVGAIYQEGKLSEDLTCKEYLQIRQEGSRPVSRRLKHYNLKLVLAVGYRVRSPRGTQFRQWATAQLEQYLVKGFAMDDERLKQAGSGDYFDELLARIREYPFLGAGLLAKGTRYLRDKRGL
jgi:hypothetical protein